MRIEFIAIGSEMLFLDRIESNSFHLQKSLRKLGLDLSRKTIIGDDRIEIQNTIEESLVRSDALILSGGLGPTVDDLTVDTIAELLGRKTYLNPTAWNKIQGRLSQIGRTPNLGHKKQAYSIEGATILENNVGQAPGQYIEVKGRHIFMLPGVPAEFKALIDDGVLPILRKISPPLKPVNILIFKFAAIAESDLDLRIASNLSNIIPMDDEELIITTKPGVQTVSLVTRLIDEELEDRKKALEKAFLDEFPDNFYSSEDKNLEETVGSLLAEKNLKLATAESCTGGLLADRITDIPGASSYFLQGLVTYHNKAKKNLLGVKEETLQAHGAVSEETAGEMCVALKIKSGADINVSITGIAGPGGGSSDKPVGTVFIGIADKNGINIGTKTISGTRRFFKEWVTSVALNSIRLRILRYH
jgi:nicotinamide-nucleotide amidase